MRNALQALPSTSRRLCQQHAWQTSASRSTRTITGLSHRKIHSAYAVSTTSCSSRVPSIEATSRIFPGRRMYSRDVKSARNVFVALGSNVGDSVRNIEQACHLIDQSGSMRVVDTSCLYRTTPMYVENQADFVNGACEVRSHVYCWL